MVCDDDFSVSGEKVQANRERVYFYRLYTSRISPQKNIYYRPPEGECLVARDSII